MRMTRSPTHNSIKLNHCDVGRVVTQSLPLPLAVLWSVYTSERTVSHTDTNCLCPSFCLLVLLTAGRKQRVLSETLCTVVTVQFTRSILTDCPSDSVNNRLKFVNTDIHTHNFSFSFFLSLFLSPSLSLLETKHVRTQSSL